MRSLILGSVILAASSCASYEPRLVPGGGGAYFIQRRFGSTLIYCQAGDAALLCQDTTRGAPLGSPPVDGPR